MKAATAKSCSLECCWSREDSFGSDSKRQQGFFSCGMSRGSMSKASWMMAMIRRVCNAQAADVCTPHQKPNITSKMTYPLLTHIFITHSFLLVFAHAHSYRWSEQKLHDAAKHRFMSLCVYSCEFNQLLNRPQLISSLRSRPPGQINCATL